METIELPEIPRRAARSHKGDYGKVLIIGGSETMIGAPALAALAACRSGAGLCRIAAPREILPHVIVICPCATGYAINAREMKGLLAFAEEHDAVAVGPGFGQGPVSRRVVLELLQRHSGPLVLDADALNILAALEASEWPVRGDWSNVVLTPHMGEFMRLMAAVMKRGGDIALAAAALGKTPEPCATSQRGRALRRTLAPGDDDLPSTADGIPLEMPDSSPPEPVSGFQPVALTAAPALARQGDGDRSALAELLSRGTGCVVVLKGHQTVIADGPRMAVNQTGNPAMATGGSGDVLTGVVAALIGQGFRCAEAAVLAAHVHGLAGDMAAAQIGPAGLLATDIVAMLPRALATRLAAEEKTLPTGPR